MEGRLIGQYRVIGVLGEGGMGVVYAARHTLLHRPAAVKVLLPKLSSDQQIVARFFNEARAATAIRHPGIVEVYDFGWTPEGAAFIVMEHLQGETLRARRTRGPLPWNLALAVTRQIAGALGAAHAMGIVHRDLKPDNIFLVPDPEVPGGERIKLLDFGIAKLADAEAGQNVTRTGAIIGTPTYMAPEQCRGVAVDSRADLYSLGCILFELLTGRPPFVGEGAGEVLAAHIHVPPPPLESLIRGLPNGVEALVQRLLTKAAVDRVQTAAEVIRLIDAAGATRGGRDAITASSLPLLQPSGSSAAHAAFPAEGILSADTTLSRAISSSHRVPASPAKHRRLALVVAAGGAVALAAIIAPSIGGGADEPAVDSASSPYGSGGTATTSAKEALPPPPPPSPSQAAAPPAPPSSPPSSPPASPASAPSALPPSAPAPSVSAPSPSATRSRTAARSLTKTERSPPIIPRAPAPRPEPTKQHPVTLETPTPPTVEAAIDSSPAGAEIVHDGKVIGKTPFRGPLPRADGAIKLSLRLRGHAQQSLTVYTSGPIKQVVTLVPTERDGVVNPFK